MNPARFVALIAIAWMCEASALAQSSASVFGRIVDPSGAPVPAAGLTVVNEDNGFRHTTRSQTDGTYSAVLPAAGKYKITVRKEGFRTMIRFHVSVETGVPARADFTLVLGSVQETITVEGAAPNLSQDPSVVATTASREELDRLPLNGRGILGLVELGPADTIVPATRGDAGQFSSDGQRPNTNSFTIDGISANNGIAAGGIAAQAAGGALPVMSAFGSLDPVIPLEAIEEFRIQSSSSASSFGRLPGANVSIVSRSGSDELHGSASFGFRHELLSANDWMANRAGEPRTTLREQNTKGTLGGPLWRNRTFFFLSYERMALDQPFAWVEAYPTLPSQSVAPAWAQPALALFPIPNGPSLSSGLAEWNGTSSRPGMLQAASLRLDQNLTDRFTLFARFSHSPSGNQFGLTQIDYLNFLAWSGTLGLNVRTGATGVVDLRVNESYSSAHSYWSGANNCAFIPIASQYATNPSNCNLLVRFEIGGVGQLVAGPESAWAERQFQFVASTGWKQGAHAPRLGADYRRIAPERQDSANAFDLIADDLTALQNGNIWIGRSPALSGSEPVRELSLWAHDTWQIAPRLTVNLGLRWEDSPSPISANLSFLDLAADAFVPGTRPLWLNADGHLAPRLGIAFQPRHDGRTVVRLGGGVYYDSALSIATDAINAGPLSIQSFTSSRYGVFSTQLSYGFDPNLVLPRVVQWNASIEQQLTARDTVSAGYLGSAGRDLIRREIGGPGSAPTSLYALTTNNGASDYHAFVAQYHRRMARGLEGIVSYTWSHSLDNDSSDAFLMWAGPSATAARDWGSSDFDVRHSLTASLGYALPGLARGWSLDGILRARTGFPITVLDSDQYMGIDFTNAFRPNLVPGESVWVNDGAAPGGRALNSLAFQPAAGAQGDLGRNAISGFGMWQLDLSLRREFRFADRRTIDLRVQAFNALNHPNFADPVHYLNSPLFGQSTSMLNMMLGTGSPGSGLSPLLQNGGARSVELVLRLRF